MADNYKGSSKLVNSAYLYRNLQQLDAKRDKVLQDGLDKELYIYTVDHYEVCLSSDEGALFIVNDTATPNDGEIKLSDVTPVQPDGTVVNVGDYVKFVPSVKTDVTKYIGRNEIDVDTVSKLSTIEETLDDGSKKQYLGFNNEKIETELQLDDVPTKDSDKFVNSGAVYSSLYHTETVTVVDQEQYYNIATSGDSGALKVVLTVSDSSTEIALTDINTQTVPVDLSALTGDGTEYVVLVPSTTHNEDVEVETYRKASESYTKEEVDAKILQSQTGVEMMTIGEYEEYWNGLTITSKNYTPVAP